VVIFSAHGVSWPTGPLSNRADRFSSGLLLSPARPDATCPLVSRVHRRVMLLNKIGYDVLVLGHRGHPEVEGTCGYATGAVHVVSRPAEVAELQVADPQRVGYVTQTTLSLDDTRDLLAAIRHRFPT
jgi:4-hydroxy-3-methylbut-2-en-1-yl diphosphate reductase